MEHDSKLRRGSMRAGTVLERVSHLSVDGRLAQAMHLELQEMGMPRANLFLVGPRSVTQNLLDLLMPDLRMPIATWFPGEPMELAPAMQSGTMIFYDIGALASHDQRRLLDHLASGADQPQIISTSSTPLFPRVHAGTFDDTLYYRLNHVYMDLSGPPSRPL
jgi:sigma-54-interacting transcriptional regulator